MSKRTAEGGRPPSCSPLESGTHPRTLVLGYGDAQRGDDALGCQLAEAARALGYHVHTCPQLSPELVDELQSFDCVIFADAAHNQAGVELRPVDPGSPLRSPMAGSDGGDWPLHGGRPAQLLGLCQHLYGRCPEGWWLLLPGQDFGLHPGLTPTALDSLAEGLRRLSALAPRSGSL